MKELSGIKVMFGNITIYIIPAFMRCNKKAAAVLIFACLIQTTAAAQGAFFEDTISISSITVTASAALRLSPFCVMRVDSAMLDRFIGDDLAALLQSGSAITVKRNGNSGLATVSMRGMPGSHTMVTWNGIPINAPSNGYSDFAIIPVMSSSAIQVTAGGYDLRDITGSTGGKIELLSEPAFGRGTKVALSAGAGSCRSYASSLALQKGSDKIALNASIWDNRARNDFEFVNTGSPGGETHDRRSNSSYYGNGVLSDLAFRFKRSAFSAHIWYNNYDRELPGPVSAVQENYGENQKDRSLKSAIKYSVEGRKLTSEITVGESYDINLYKNETFEISSDNRSEIWLARGSIGYRPGQNTELILNAGYEYQVARSAYYDNEEGRNIFSTSLTARYNPGMRLKLLLQARQLAVTGTRVSPEFTAGATYLLTTNGRHVVKATVSRNLKLPCLNDLYWVPGGNPDLKPEVSAGGEAGYSFAGTGKSGIRSTVDLYVYGSRVDNLIQWVPDNGSGIWSARNISTADITGIESRFGTEIPFENGSMTAHLNYILTRSVTADSELQDDISEGRQMIYIPLHNLNLNADAKWHFITAGLDASYQSRRYTAADESEWLPALFIADARLGTAFSVRRSAVVLNLIINNVAGSSYESVRNYPMPLRTFTVKMNITFSGRNKING